MAPGRAGASASAFLCLPLPLPLLSSAVLCLGGGPRADGPKVSLVTHTRSSSCTDSPGDKMPGVNVKVLERCRLACLSLMRAASVSVSASASAPCCAVLALDSYEVFSRNIPHISKPRFLGKPSVARLGGKEKGVRFLSEYPFSESL